MIGNSIEAEPLSGVDKTKAAQLWLFQKTLRQSTERLIKQNHPLVFSFNIENVNWLDTGHRLIYDACDFEFEPKDRHPRQLMDVLEVLEVLRYYNAPVTNIIEQAVCNPRLDYFRNSLYGITVHRLRPADTDRLLHEVVGDHLRRAESRSKQTYQFLRQLHLIGSKEMSWVEIEEIIERAVFVRSIAGLEAGQHQALILNKTTPVSLRRISV